MKYLYKGMGLPGWGDISGSVLLGWHEKVRFHLPNCREEMLSYYLSLILLAVNRGCRSGMYCSSNDGSKNRVIIKFYIPKPH